MKRVLLAGTAMLATACAQHQDRITFVTTSQIGISTDSDTGTASIGYDREELIIAPVNQSTGAIDPLYANIQQGGTLTDPTIKQTFATGEAARIISLGPGSDNDDEISAIRDEAESRRAQVKSLEKSSNNSKVLVFGTQSNIGIKLGLGASQAPEINLGYKRKERAAIPKVQDSGGSGQNAASLFGSLSVGVGVGSNGGVGNSEFRLKQVIATGSAAENAASSEDARSEVSKAVVAATQKECANGQTVSNDEDCPPAVAAPLVNTSGDTN